MGVESRHGDARVGDAHAAQRRIRRADRVQHAVARDELDRAAQARVQRRVRDAHFGPARVEAEHEERVLGRNAGAARDERGIAVEVDSGELDRAFRMRCGDDRVHFAGERRVDRGLRRIERGFAVRRGDCADLQLAGLELPALDQSQRAVVPGGISIVVDGDGDEVLGAAAADRQACAVGDVDGQAGGDCAGACRGFRVRSYAQVDHHRADLFLSDSHQHGYGVAVRAAAGVALFRGRTRLGGAAAMSAPAPGPHPPRSARHGP